MKFRHVMMLVGGMTVPILMGCPGPSPTPSPTSTKIESLEASVSPDSVYAGNVINLSGNVLFNTVGKSVTLQADMDLDGDYDIERTMISDTISQSFSIPYTTDEVGDFQAPFIWIKGDKANAYASTNGYEVLENILGNRVQNIVITTPHDGTNGFLSANYDTVAGTNKVQIYRSDYLGDLSTLVANADAYLTNTINDLTAGTHSEAVLSDRGNIEQFLYFVPNNNMDLIESSMGVTSTNLPPSQDMVVFIDGYNGTMADGTIGYLLDKYDNVRAQASSSGSDIVIPIGKIRQGMNLEIYVDGIGNIGNLSYQPGLQTVSLDLNP